MIDITAIEVMAVSGLSQRIEKGQSIDREILKDTVNRLSEAFGGIEDNAREALVRKLETRFDVRLGIGAVIKEDYKPWLAARKASLNPFYWSRYKGYLLDRGFPPYVVNTLDDITDQTLGLLGDPTSPARFYRRGLVVGHVQSGKTANYIGLINKAADAGYKFIVLIAGVLNNLRRQTQERVDNGFVGRDSSALIQLDSRDSARLVGVGLRDSAYQPVVLTSTTNDFSLSVAQQVGLTLDAVNVPIILVIKKHTNTLANLIQWVRVHNAGRDGLVDVPMLLIDDEADYASVNTTPSGSDPTTINRRIRELLKQFSRKSYVGYTATPFANIFIHPDTTTEMLGDDLFPKDFIVSLDAPTNYFGPSAVFGESPEYPKSLSVISDYAESLPLVHKKDMPVETIPDSLKHAVRTFVLCRAIRLLRGQIKQHNSMLVNVSRFTDVQSRVRDHIRDYLGQLQNTVRYGYKKPSNEVLMDPLMRELHASWLAEYSDTSWSDVVPWLHEAIQPIEVVEVNIKTGAGSLDYTLHRQDGLNVIAVGGLSLSRGFTLEGLSISYLLRNTQMYDTLLQMGRWFGYREGYGDLCRVYMPAESAAWYAHIAESTEELRHELRRMQSLGLTPSDFGLMVRSHPDSLMVTAQNKMREARTVYREIALGGRLIETYRIHADARRSGGNRLAVEQLIGHLKSISAPQAGAGGNLVWRDVPRDAVLQFLRVFDSHPGAVEAQTAPILSYCEDQEYKEMDLWDVVLVGKQSGKDEAVFAGINVKIQERSAIVESRPDVPPSFRISGSASRVASRGLEREGLSPEQIAQAEANYREQKSMNPALTNISDAYFREVRTRPLLMIHPLKLVEKGMTSGDPKILTELAIAYGISFPESPSDRRNKTVKYEVNLVWWRSNFEDDISEELESD